MSESHGGKSNRKYIGITMEKGSNIKNWNSLTEMFNDLNNSDVLYVVLRNYEELSDGNYYLSEHADIDFLTESSARFVNVIGGFPRFIKDDHIHYFVRINNVDVVIDVREVGDGYYDKHWQKKMLEDRIKVSDYFVLNAKDYYYSLAYHALLQKEEVSEEYLNRLNAMAEAIHIEASTEHQHLKQLDRFMVENGYCYTIPYDVWVPLKAEKTDGKRIRKQMNVRIRNACQTLLVIGSKIKHSLFR